MSVNGKRKFRINEFMLFKLSEGTQERTEHYGMHTFQLFI